MSTGADKAALRAWAQSRRADLPDVSGGVVTHLSAWLRARGARRVLAYRALPGEVRLDALAAEFEVFTTRAWWRPEPRLTVHAWDAATEVSRLGIVQPPRDAPVVPPQSLDVVLVPGLAFDVRGGRLGFGGGFYDRLLPQLTAVRVGVCPAALVLDAVPVEPHDARVQFLATEAGVHPTVM